MSSPSRTAQAIGQLPEDLEHKGLNRLGLPPTWLEYLQRKLAGEMWRQRGRKRLRKKKAKRVLRGRHRLICIAYAIGSRRVDYAEIGRRLVSIETLPPPAGRPFYLKDGEQ